MHFNFIPVINLQDCITLNVCEWHTSHYFSLRCALTKIWSRSPALVWWKVTIMLFAATSVSLQSSSRLEGRHANDPGPNTVPVAIDRLCSLEKVLTASWLWQFVNYHRYLCWHCHRIYSSGNTYNQIMMDPGIFEAKSITITNYKHDHNNKIILKIT